MIPRTAPQGWGGFGNTRWQETVNKWCSCSCQGGGTLTSIACDDLILLSRVPPSECVRKPQYAQRRSRISTGQANTLFQRPKSRALDRPKMSSQRRAAKKPRLGERTMLACIGCKQRKLKVRSLHRSYQSPPLAILTCAVLLVRWPKSQVPELHQDRARYWASHAIMTRPIAIDTMSSPRLPGRGSHHRPSPPPRLYEVVGSQSRLSRGFAPRCQA